LNEAYKLNSQWMKETIDCLMTFLVNNMIDRLIVNNKDQHNIYHG